MRYFFLSLLMLFPMLLSAGNVSEKRAAEIADAFWNASVPHTRASSADLKMVLHSEMSGLLAGGYAPASASLSSYSGAPAYYVYDNASGPGFVIVAGDDSVEPILGYSFENDFPQGPPMPANLLGWLGHIRAQILASRAAGVTASADVAQKWAETRSGNIVVQLETADWNQEEPYNLLCPYVNNSPVYTGCSATALAILMRYHSWPVRGTGTLPSYSTTTYGQTINSIALGHTYDWSNMLLDYSGYSNSTQKNAVATLMRDCAVMLQSDFCPVGSAGTGAYTNTIPQLLSTYMDYDKSARNLYRDDFGTSQWLSMIKAELDAERPVYYTGYDYDGGSGHAFILDGYTSDDYFGLNWGWGGYFNGYFLLDALDPTGTGAGGGTGSFNDGQSAIIGLQRNFGGDYVDDIGFTPYMDNYNELYNGLGVDRTVEQNKPFNLKFGLLYNRGSFDFVGTICLAVVDHDGNIVETLYDGMRPSDSEPLRPGYGYAAEISVTVRQVIRDGYRIRALFKSDRTPEWTVVTGNDEAGCVWDLLIADEYVEPVEPKRPIEEETALTYSKSDKILHLTVPEDVSVSLFGPSGEDLSSSCTTEGQEVKINTMLLPAGRCRLVLQRDDETKELTFTVTASDSRSSEALSLPASGILSDGLSSGTGQLILVPFKPAEGSLIQ